MPIPESQLQTWTHRGAEATAASTHHTIRLAMDNGQWRKETPETYLQGSYRNATNIRGDSDVDIVAELSSVFFSNIQMLDPTAIRAHKSAFPEAEYTWQDLQADALSILRTRFGYNAITVGKKCLQIAGENGRLPADVVLCFQYRNYRRFVSVYDQDFVSGITFYIPSEDRWAVNYPKQHISNGAAKSSDTRDAYKPTVRMFKNARRYLVSQNMMDKKTAPSYFLEGLMSNVPNTLFIDTYGNRYLQILKWLIDAVGSGKAEKFTCQNRQQWLFGSIPEQWSMDNAITTLTKLVDLWSQW